MTRVDALADALAASFSELNAVALARHLAFRIAAERSISLLGGVDRVAAAVVATGGLRGARNPGAVIVTRLRRIVENAERQSPSRHHAELRDPHYHALNQAAQRGEELRAHLARGALTYEEAAATIMTEFGRDSGMGAIAQAALDGRQSGPFHDNQRPSQRTLPASPATGGVASPPAFSRVVVPRERNRQ